MVRKPRVDKASERLFEKLCSDAGIYCQKVTEDETGWDYLAEFQPVGHVGPAESQHGGKRAFVQVKSRIQPTAKTEVTLSNARKMVQDPSPWFVVLFHIPAGGQPEIYAKHIWGDLIADCLKRIRRTDTDGKDLHRVKMTINFADLDRHTSDLCAWMEKTINEAGRGYAELKRDRFEKSGYEEGYGTGTFTVRANSAEEIADAFLGLGDGIEIADWKFVQRRFGITSPFPELEMVTGKMTVTPLAHEKCSVRLRQVSTGDVIFLDGTFVHNGLASFDFKLGKAHLKAGFLDATFSTDTTFNLTIKTDLGTPYPLSYWRDFAKASIWLSAGDAFFEIWFKDERIFEVEMSEPKRDRPPWWADVEETAEKLKQIAGNDVVLYLNDLYKALPQAKTLAAITFAPRMAFQFPISADLPGDFDHALYYAATSIGGRTFCSMVARPVIDARLEGESERRIVMGQAKILDGYATADPLESQQSVLQAKFEKLIDTVGDRVLGIGDINSIRPDVDVVVRVGGRLIAKT